MNDSFKVLLINGSPRENGNTFTALSEIAKALNSEGIGTEIISIGMQAIFKDINFISGIYYDLSRLTCV